MTASLLTGSACAPLACVCARAACRQMRVMSTARAGAQFGGAADVRDSTVLISGGGMAGIGAAMKLVAAGVDVLLCEQGRGVGGRVCTRHVRDRRLSFDHGCQYFAPKEGSAFSALLLELERDGVVGRWSAGTRRLGNVACDAAGRLDAASFAPWEDAEKTAFVGVPSMSVVGKALLSSGAQQPGAGALMVALSTRVAPGSLRIAPSGGWLADTHAKSEPSALRTTQHRVVLALGSASSTFNVIAPAAPGLAAAAGEVRADACWALMVAFAAPLFGASPRFDGALVSGSDALAWIANNSSKPGRGGDAECWVVHAAPGWSNTRRDAAPADVAQQLLAAFLHAAGRDAAPPPVLHTEAFKWNAAFPLSVADSRGTHCFTDADKRLGLAGDWCIGPRAGDAWSSGQAAAEAVLRTML